MLKLSHLWLTDKIHARSIGPYFAHRIHAAARWVVRPQFGGPAPSEKWKCGRLKAYTALPTFFRSCLTAKSHERRLWPYQESTRPSFKGAKGQPSEAPRRVAGIVSNVLISRAAGAPAALNVELIKQIDDTKKQPLPTFAEAADLSGQNGRRGASTLA